MYSGSGQQKQFSVKNSGTYYYRISATNEYGVTSGWSTGASVAVVYSYTISGTVSGASGVTVTLGGDASDTRIVNDGGNYSFTVNEGGSYTVTPSKTGYTFTPSTSMFNDVRSYKFQNYTALKNTYTISGTVTGADGVTVTLSGDASGSQTVNSGGSYSFTVDYGGNYTVTTSKTGFTFTSSSQAFNNVTSNQAQNFTAIKNTYTISGLIAFTSTRDGNYEIYVMNADGSSQRNITNNSADDRFPFWSPDGSQIAFGSTRDGNWEIYVMNADGSSQRNVTNNSADDFYSSWSPK